MTFPFSNRITQKIELKVTGLVFLCAFFLLSLLGRYSIDQITGGMVHRLTVLNERVTSRIGSIVHEKEKTGLLFAIICVHS